MPAAGWATAFAWAVAFALIGTCRSAEAATAVADASPRIINGLPTQSFPTTGALLTSGGGAITTTNASMTCSGTLIGCRTFLVAAHCVVDDTNASHYWVYLQHGGIHAVSSITYNPSYDSNFSGRDVAVIKLSADVTGIDPTTINTTHDLDALGVGLDGTIAGFGNTGGGHYGVKYYGDMVTADCVTSETGGESNDKLVCWDYASPIGPAGTDSDTCDGDSGGPLFMDFSGATELVGVTSAGSSANCTPTDHSWDASVYYNRVWIDSEIGADSTNTCGGLPPVGDSAVTINAFSGTLSSGNLDDSYTFNVTGNPSVLRVTLNADDGRVNPDLFVRSGTGASATLFDCKSDGAMAYGACEFSNPAAGTWSIFVRRTSGSGVYQLTATAFGDPAICGNNVAESGEECDGSDLGSCVVGPCTACECPAPVCGNNLVESGEDCDGTSDGACPGECSGCSCPNTCVTGDLYGLAIVSDESRFVYKADLFDAASMYDNLDPRGDVFSLSVTDGFGTVMISIPANDPGWVKADPVSHRYGWKGDGSQGGLRRVKLSYKQPSSGAFWLISVRGKEVPNASSIDVNSVLDFDLEFDGSCQLEQW